MVEWNVREIYCNSYGMEVVDTASEKITYLCVKRCGKVDVP